MTLIDELATVIDRVASTVARGYPGVDPEDIRQELAVFLLTDGKGVDPAEEAGARYILFRAAHIYARKERAAQLSSTSQYNYRPDDVRQILETVFSSPDAWADAYVPDDAKSSRPASDPLDVVIDTRTALGELDIEDANAIAERYLFGTVSARGSAERRRLDRAVLRLVDQMNSYSAANQRPMDVAGHPGSRRAASNAQALATLRSQS